MKGLIVEDNVVSAAVFEETLANNDIDAVAVNEARSGLDVLRDAQGEIDAILVDLMMPDMDGFQFIREVRKNQAWRDIPVGMCSAATEETLKTSALLGVELYLLKPPTEADLVATLREAVG
jgi:two-component system chemotaxis response regulator CheY